jgi:hypothetical protein
MTSSNIQGNDSVRSTLNRVETSYETFRVERDGQLPLQFEGVLLGSSRTDLTAPRGTEVCIYVTRRGKYITHVFQWQRKDDSEDMKRTRNTAAVHEQADQALEWLITDGNGVLGSSSRIAWEEACQTWPALHGLDVECVE